MFGFNKLNFGVIGTGYMAGVISDTLKYVPSLRPYAVASRSLDRAMEFGKNHNFKKGYGSYEDLVNDPEVDLIYIATPVTEHYDHIRLCIEHKIPVICEKPFALSAAEAQRLFAMAKARGVFLADGLRLRFLPFGVKIKEVLESGMIGTPVMLSADLAFPIAGTARVVNPMLGGGALMEVGTYLLSAAAMFFGDDIKRISSTCVYTKEGLDKQDCVTLEYGDGRLAVLSFTISGAGENRCVITGTTGYMVIDNITGLGSLTVYDAARNQIAQYNRPRQKTGYEYVLKACADAVKEGKTECPQAPCGQTISILHMTDFIRGQLGIRYPKEMEEDQIPEEEGAADEMPEAAEAASAISGEAGITEADPAATGSADDLPEEGAEEQQDPFGAESGAMQSEEKEDMESMGQGDPSAESMLTDLGALIASKSEEDEVEYGAVEKKKTDDPGDENGSSAGNFLGSLKGFFKKDQE